MTDTRTVPVEGLESLPRYRIRLEHGALMVRDLTPTGRWVEYSDIEALIAAAPQPEPECVELAELEREIATANADVFIRRMCELTADDWYVVTDLVSDHVRYYELRGLLIRHRAEPNLVRIKE